MFSIVVYWVCCHHEVKELSVVLQRKEERRWLRCGRGKMSWLWREHCCCTWCVFFLQQTFVVVVVVVIYTFWCYYPVIPSVGDGSTRGWRGMKMEWYIYGLLWVERMLQNLQFFWKLASPPPPHHTFSTISSQQHLQVEYYCYCITTFSHSN